MANRKKTPKRTRADAVTALTIAAALLTATTRAVELIEAIKHLVR